MGTGTPTSKRILTRLFKFSTGSVAFALAVWFVQRIDNSIANFTVEDVMNLAALSVSMAVAVEQMKAAFAPSTTGAR